MASMFIDLFGQAIEVLENLVIEEDHHDHDWPETELERSDNDHEHANEDSEESEEEREESQHPQLVMRNQSGKLVCNICTQVL